MFLVPSFEVFKNKLGVSEGLTVTLSAGHCGHDCYDMSLCCSNRKRDRRVSAAVSTPSESNRWDFSLITLQAGLSAHQHQGC